MPEIQNFPALDIKTLNPPMNITLVTPTSGLDKLKAWADALLAQPVPVCGHDTETNVTADFWFRRVRSIQIGDKENQFVIDLLTFAGSEEALIASQGNYGKNNNGIYDAIFAILDPILCTGKVLKVGQNLAFEYEVNKWNFGRRIWRLYSTDLAERVLQAGGNISLKQYAKFSMLALVERYFQKTIDKSKQKSFDLKTPLTQEQIDYAALDIRMPLALRQMQMQVLLPQQLFTTATIENDALGSYTDMHITGQNLDDARWMKRIEAVKARRIDEIKTLDDTFIAIVGRKSEAIDHAEIARREKIWKENFEKPTDAETAKAVEIRQEKDKEKKEVLRAELKALKEERRLAKAAANKAYHELSKDRTAKNKIIEKCEGEAFLNYGSNTQLLAAVKTFPGMRTIDSVGDDTLIKFNDRPIIQVLRKYRKGKKETGTYGEQWTQRWITKPCKEEGWRHPGDGRLHCLFNQLEAETGRSSSSKPNAQNLPHDDEVRACFICDPPDADEPEGYVIVTVDMSGAELRIIAELAGAKSWINAFAKDQDVHSVSTEILYPEKWPLLTVRSKMFPDGWTDEHIKSKTEMLPQFNDNGTPMMVEEKGKLVHLHVPPCAYYATAAKRIVLANGQVIEAGEMLRRKCKCPRHNELRNGTKATNFLLCYGGGPDALADAIGCSLDTAKELMRLHEAKFPDVWRYLQRSGEQAQANGEARDLYGRRRLFVEPNVESATAWYEEYEHEKLELSDEQQVINIFNFKAKELREPKEDELWLLTHRHPEPNEIRHAMRAMMGSIARRGKNHCIQGTNASIIKRAMGCGFDKDGKGYLWHLLPQYKAKLLNMIHDELVVQCPKRFANDVAQTVGDAFKRAAAEVMKSVIMEFEFNVADRWMK
jgi:DNA polymerase I-like protein with 3'-5' exonuclease and polymerase domains